jgi:hypothetical protein
MRPSHETTYASRLEVEAEADDGDLRRRGDPEIDEVVAHLRADGDERVARAGEPLLELAERLGLGGAEVAAEHVPVEGVHDHLRAGGAGHHRREPADGAGLGGVRVEDVRPDLADDAQQAARRDRVGQGRDLPLELRDVERVDAELVGDVLHRPLAAADPARHEGRPVADAVELPAEVGDVQGRPADVEARDDTQDADRRLAGCHEAMLAAPPSS